MPRPIRASRRARDPLTLPAKICRPSADATTAETASSPRGAIDRQTGLRWAETSYSLTSPRSRCWTKPWPVARSFGESWAILRSVSQIGTCRSNSSFGRFRARQVAWPVSTDQTDASAPLPPTATAEPPVALRATAAVLTVWKSSMRSVAGAAASARHAHTCTRPRRSVATTRGASRPVVCKPTIPQLLPPYGAPTVASPAAY
eukprot:scaffold4364_cov119-Isochrysis_galbana.AAC.7